MKSIERKIKHLDLIENVITRMAEFSAKCKEFCILICSALLTVYATIDSQPVVLVFLCLIPLFIFWALDSYYLYIERLYRDKYDEICKKNESEYENFSNFDLKFERSFKKYLEAAFNRYQPLYFMHF